MIATKADAKMHYEKACHLGKKEGGSPAVLDTILKSGISPRRRKYLSALSISRWSGS